MSSVNRPSENEPFADEIRIALFSIERLTPTESAAILNFMEAAKCEPIVAFVGLHIKLGRVLSSSHGDMFLSSLRAWGGNAAIDRALWEHWPQFYRPRYRPGYRGNLSALDVSGLSGLTLVGENAVSEIKSDEVKSVVSSLDAGDVFRWRMEFWQPGEWKTYEVVSRTPRGNLKVRHPGKRTVSTFSPADVAADPRASIEVIQRSMGETGSKH